MARCCCIAAAPASAEAFSHDDIALLADGSRSTVQRTLTAYLEGGLERIRQVPSREAHSELDDHRVSLEEVFSKQPPPWMRS